MHAYRLMDGAEVIDNLKSQPWLTFYLLLNAKLDRLQHSNLKNR